MKFFPSKEDMKKHLCILYILIILSGMFIGYTGIVKLCKLDWQYWYYLIFPTIGLLWIGLIFLGLKRKWRFIHIIMIPVIWVWACVLFLVYIVAISNTHRILHPEAHASKTMPAQCCEMAEYQQNSPC